MKIFNYTGSPRVCYIYIAFLDGVLFESHCTYM